MKSTSMTAIALLFTCACLQAEDSPPNYHGQLDTISRGYDGKTCWVHPRAGTIPGESPIVVLTMQKLLLSGSDVFFALNEMRTDNLGAPETRVPPHLCVLGIRRR
jgi:hypothetical protein